MVEGNSLNTNRCPFKLGWSCQPSPSAFKYSTGDMHCTETQNTHVQALRASYLYVNFSLCLQRRIDLICLQQILNKPNKFFKHINPSIVDIILFASIFRHNSIYNNMKIFRNLPQLSF